MTAMMMADGADADGDGDGDGDGAGDDDGDGDGMVGVAASLLLCPSEGPFFVFACVSMFCFVYVWVGSEI